MKKALTIGLIGLTAIVSPILKEKYDNWLLPEPIEPIIKKVDENYIEINKFIPKTSGFFGVSWYDRVIETYEATGRHFIKVTRKEITYDYNNGKMSYSEKYEDFTEGRSRPLEEIVPKMEIPKVPYEKPIKREIQENEA